MSFTRLHFKLVHKIYALVLIPFFFNGLCLLMLNDALTRKDQMVQLERVQSRYLEDLNHGIQLFYDSTGKLFEYEITRDPAARRHSIDSLHALRELISRMRLDAAVNEKTRQSFESFASIMQRETEDIGQNEVTLDPGDTGSFFKRINAARKLLKRSLKDSSFVLDAINRKQAEMDQLRADEKRTGDNVVQLVVICFAGNLLMVGVFAYFIATDFSKRLQTLMANSQRLGKRLTLNAAPTGNDELNSLDSALRKAALDLQEAFEFRASLMEMVAHDLRSPLQSVQVTLESLTEVAHEKLDEKGVIQVERLQANNSRMLALVEDLLTVDRLDAGVLDLHLSPVKVRSVAAESVLLMAALAAAQDVTIANRCGDQIVAADARRLSQVFINLLSNAIKFSPPDSEIEILSKENGNDVVVSIIDKGTGLSQANAKHVFEKFFQVDGPRKQQGSGLGLAICKLIIDSHSGEIGVDSSLQKGSRFWFSLPRV